MKKIFLLATALAALVSCTDDQFVGESNNSPNANPAPEAGEKAIVFNSGANAITRAEYIGGTAAGMLNNQFVFAGTKGTSASSFVFDQYVANYAASTAHTTESNSNDWEYVGYTPAGSTTLPSSAVQSIKYWDYSTTQYDFAAYSTGQAAAIYTDADLSEGQVRVSAIAAGTKSYTITGAVEDLKSCYISDLVTAYNRDHVNDYGNVVKFSFRSLATKIRLAFYETVPGYAVKNIQFYPSSANNATATTIPTLFTSSAVLPSGSGTMTVSFPTTGWNNRNATDYNKAHVSFSQEESVPATSTLVFGGLANFATAEKNETSTDDPATGWIGRESNAATYAGGLEGGSGKYYTILPKEDGANLQLRIKYTLVSTDGSNEVINVDNATAVIPAELAKWNPNYAYTYIFKISNLTNGTTGVDGDGHTVTGLTPITLNAVVVDSEDGVQETITTVSNPSITTYTKGKVVTSNNEYKAGFPIYIVVNNGTSNVTLTAGTNAKLYTVTIGDDAAQTINEASVDNALANGVQGTSGNNSTWTVTDAKGQSLVVTAASGLSAVTKIEAEDSPTGNEITVAGAKFTPLDAATYVFQYVKTAPVAAVYYTAQTASEYNYSVSLNSTDALSAEQAAAYNEATGGNKVEGNTLSDEEAEAYNALVCVAEGDLKTPAVAGEYQYKIIKVVE